MEISDDVAKKIANSATAGLYIYDVVQQTNIFINSYYTELLGYTLEEINSFKEDEFILLFHKDERNSIFEHMKEIISGNHKVQIDYRFKHKNGHWVWCRSVDSPFEIADDGKVISFIGSFIDITSLKESEEALALSNHEKDRFFSIIAHDLKSPLASLLRFTNFLVEDIETLSQEEIVSFSERMNKNAKHLYNLLDNLLQWARYQMGQVECRKIEVNFADLVDEVLALFTIQAEEKSIQLKNDIPPEINVYADLDMLRTIFINLISNAIKFSYQQSTIQIRNGVEDNFVHVTVSDSGVGLSQKIHDNLFKIDGQTSRTGTSGEKGTGLGLILCKQFVEEMEGTIWVESVLENGTTVHLTIPKFHGQGLDKVSLLMADDDPDFQIINRRILKKMGVTEIDVVSNGFEAVKASEKKNYDIILMDINMPEMNGIEATRKIIQSVKKHVPKIIGWTSTAFPKLKPQCREAGMKEILSKSISMEDLRKILLNWA